MKEHLRTLPGNDAPYDVAGCPFYSRWTGILSRCGGKYDACYGGVKVCKEWQESFMAFRSWMETQDWEGRQLDKDLKGDGTLYSPDTCLFVPPWINGFLPDVEPKGYSIDKRVGKYRATVMEYGKQRGLGYYDTPEEARSAHIHAKMMYMMKRQVDTNVLPHLAKTFKQRYPGTYIYAAGPMRGLPEFNFPAFDEASAKLRKRGFIVFNPAERDRATGFDPTGMTGNENLVDLGFCLRDALGTDVSWICHFADAIYLLDGWESSLGAIAERALAEALGLQVINDNGPFRSKILDFINKKLASIAG